MKFQFLLKQDGPFRRPRHIFKQNINKTPNDTLALVSHIITNIATFQ
jgi:hypothetical protein